MCSIADGAAQRASISHLGRVERLVGVQREEATTSMRFDQVAHIRADWQCQRRQSVSSSGLGPGVFDETTYGERRTGAYKNVYVHWTTHIAGTRAYSVRLGRRLDPLRHAFWYSGELHVRHRKRIDLPLVVEGIS
jgi:hypothetical protein